MGDRRNGLGSLYSPVEGRKILTVPVCGVLLDAAIPIFTETSRSNPARLVWIRPKINPTTFVLGPLFPVAVYWTQWEPAIREILEDSRFQDPKAAWMKDPTQLRELVGWEIQRKLSENGFGPISK